MTQVPPIFFVRHGSLIQQLNAWNSQTIVAAACTLVINPLTIPPMYYAAYRIGSWELHHDAHLVNPTTAARVSGELGRFLFWIHEASGPIGAGEPRRGA